MLAALTPLIAWPTGSEHHAIYLAAEAREYNDSHPAQEPERHAAVLEFDLSCYSTAGAMVADVIALANEAECGKP